MDAPKETDQPDDEELKRAEEIEKEKKERRMNWIKTQNLLREHGRRKREMIERYERERAEKIRQDAEMLGRDMTQKLRLDGGKNRNAPSTSRDEEKERQNRWKPQEPRRDHERRKHQRDDIARLGDGKNSKSPNKQSVFFVRGPKTPPIVKEKVLTFSLEAKATDAKKPAINFDNFELVRRPGEGSRPIFDRPELRDAAIDYRTIGTVNTSRGTENPGPSTSAPIEEYRTISISDSIIPTALGSLRSEYDGLDDERGSSRDSRGSGGRSIGRRRSRESSPTSRRPRSRTRPHRRERDDDRRTFRRSRSRSRRRSSSSRSRRVSLPRRVRSRSRSHSSRRKIHDSTRRYSLGDHDGGSRSGRSRRRTRSPRRSGRNDDDNDEERRRRDLTLGAPMPYPNMMQPPGMFPMPPFAQRPMGPLPRFPFAPPSGPRNPFYRGLYRQN